MRKDGSVFPGEETMEDEGAKIAFATDKAAVFFGGWWVPGNVLAYNPDADFDLVLPPTPDDGVRRGFSYMTMEGKAEGYVVSSQTKNPHAVWEVIKFLSSREYQEAYVQGGFGISYLPEADKEENFKIPQMYKLVQWAIDPALRRIGPVLPGITTRMGEYGSGGIYPPWADVIDNVYFEKAGLEALLDLDKRQDGALEASIKKAQEAGVKVSRSDFIVADWDPSMDYVRKRK